jgi:hypothetical protein
MKMQPLVLALGLGLGAINAQRQLMQALPKYTKNIGYFR